MVKLISEAFKVPSLYFFVEVALGGKDKLAKGFSNA